MFGVLYYVISLYSVFEWFLLANKIIIIITITIIIIIIISFVMMIIIIPEYHP